MRASKLTILVRDTTALTDVLSQGRDKGRLRTDAADVLDGAPGGGDAGEAGLLGAGGQVGEGLGVDEVGGREGEEGEGQGGEEEGGEEVVEVHFSLSLFLF